MIDRHFHWKFLAYNGEPPADQKVEIHFGVTVEVIGYLDEASARIAAQDVVQREQYALYQVWECTACGFQADVAESQRALVKAAGQ